MNSLTGDTSALGFLAAAGLGLLGFWLAKLVRVCRNVRRYADHWAVPQGDSGGLLYVALGDSAAQGVGASRPELGYVGLLADRMRARTGQSVRVVNLSCSGATLADLVQHQLPLLANLRPDVVTVAIGGNDVLAYEATMFSAQVCALTAGLPPGTVIADVPYFMHGHWERRASEAGRVLTDCARASGLHVVHLHDAERARGSMAMLTDFAADWFHPNNRGHRVWADAFWDQLTRNAPLSVEPASSRHDPFRGSRSRV